MTLKLPETIKWFGFDLDDTLHYFRKASERAAVEVFMYLHEEFGCDMGNLARTYSGILKEAQKRGFVEGKSSREYREERFGELLNRFSIVPYRHLDWALDLYDEALARNLELKEGAEDILRKLKLSGWPILIISEGPHDAQETTLKRLGIAQFVDLLITSSKEGLTKKNGLFQRALEKTSCSADTLVFVGDSIENDLIPARALGINAVYIGTERDLPSDVRKISSLAELENMLPRSLLAP